MKIIALLHYTLSLADSRNEKKRSITNAMSQLTRVGESVDIPVPRWSLEDDASTSKLLSTLRNALFSALGGGAGGNINYMVSTDALNMAMVEYVKEHGEIVDIADVVEMSRHDDERLEG